MNQADIETFLMLVRTRNITKTAESLFVSQPTVSHRLKLLEEELDRFFTDSGLDHYMDRYLV